MIRLMIVDDEEAVREGIKNTIDWESNGIKVVGEAENGKEALRLIDELFPDLLLIDIRMPVMGGLQVLQYLQASGRNIHSIILSGYDDFTYAQEALKLGASDYLLKPSRPEEILCTVLKVKTGIDGESARNELFNQLKLQFNRSLPLLKEKYLNKLLTPSRKSKDNIKENFSLYRINLKPASLVVALIRIDDFYRFCAERSNEDVELMKFAIKNIFTEILSRKCNCEIFENAEDIVAVMNWKDDLYDLLKTAKHSIDRYLGFTVSLGVSNLCHGISELHFSYCEAAKAIEAKFLAGPNSIIKYCDLQSCYTSDYFYPGAEEKDIINSIQTGNLKNMETAIGEFYSGLNKARADRDFMVKSSIALALSAYHFCIEKNVDTNTIFGPGFLFLSRLQKLDTLEQLKAHIKDILIKTYELFNEKKNGNKLIAAAIKYIEENYPTDISLKSVSKEIFITPGYLSLLFKQIMGVNFVDFLHKTRIGKACELLEDVRLKSYEVALKVGYSDEKYFSQIFKKHIGMTPTQYRSNLPP